MNPNASVTVPLHEYQRETNGMPFGAAVFVSCLTFAAGLVIGTATVDRPAPSRPTPVVETTVPARGDVPPVDFQVV